MNKATEEPVQVLPVAFEIVVMCGANPHLSKPGKTAQENWVLQSVLNGKRRGAVKQQSGYLLQLLSHGRAVVAHQAHNLKAGGSNPPSAIW